MMKTLATGAALLFAIILPGGAQAQAARAPADTVAVAYADLDLDQPAGSRLLNNRLRSAALSLCGDTNLVTTRHRQRRSCIENAMTDGWDQVATNRATRFAENRTTVLAALRPPPQP